MERYRMKSRNFNESLSSPRRPTTISLPPKSNIRDHPSIPTYSTTSAAAVVRRVATPVDDNTELSIFGAEKYFNDVVNTDVKKPVVNHQQMIEILASPRDSSVSSVDGYDGRGWRFYDTPTASSEASWNSRSGLLVNRQCSVAVSVRAFPLNEEKKSRAATSPSWRFGRNCPCSGKKSVDVEKKYSGPKTPVRSLNSVKTSSIANGLAEIKLSPPKELEGELSNKDDVTKLKIVAGSWAKEAEVFHAGSGRRRPLNDVAGGFSFPILNTPVIKPSLEDPARDSLEVFRPLEDLRGLRRSAELQRPAVATFAYPGSPKPRGSGGGDDDVSSDASSDLFEIESFSTQCRRRDSLDELETRSSGAGTLRFQRSIEEEVFAPSECHYPPSEISVEWSVATAEGFDRASVANFSSTASEFDELRYAGTEHDRLAAAAKRKAPTSGGGSGGLLTSCRCEKAVSVGPGPVRCVREQRGPVVDSACDGARKDTLVRSYSGRVSRPPLSSR